MLEQLRSDEWIDEKTVSRITGLAIPTLRNYRFRKIGVPYHVVGKRAVRYRLSDVFAYMERNRVETDDPRG